MSAAAPAERPRPLRPGSAPPLVIAHGAGNSVASASAALVAQADYVEVDLWAYRGSFESRHERRFPFRIPLLYEKWYLSLPRRLSTLETVLTACGTGTGVFLDLKSGGAGTARLVAATFRAGPPGQRMAASSQSWEALRAVAREVPAVDVFYSVDVAAKLDLLFSVVRRDRVAKGTSCRHTLLTQATVERLHDAGLAVIAWTVDDADRARELARWGVDAITTHEVAAVRAAVAGP
jgi:glycerophosphoryl diester phosphodiesterase